MIDLTLDRLKRPAIKGASYNFGTTVEVTDKNKGGLSTTEVDANMAFQYELMREVNVSASDETSIVEYNAKLAFVGDEVITLRIQNGSYIGCTVKVTNRGTQTNRIEFNTSDSLTLTSTSHVTLEWAGGDWITIQDAVSGNTAETPKYTYVIDSDTKLLEWANNDKTRNQNYTGIRIAKGEWRCDKGVNLTESNTVWIVADEDSKLIFNSTKGLYYTTQPDSSDFSMSNVTVEVNAEINEGLKNNNVATAFECCVNLEDCAGSTNIIVSDDTYACGIGFNNCLSLKNCTGKSDAMMGNLISDSHGFYNCKKIYDSQGEAHSKGMGCGFELCEDIFMCTGIGEGWGYDIGEANQDILIWGGGCGFRNCINLSECTGKGQAILTEKPNTSELGIYGFFKCSNLFKCYSILQGDQFSTETIYGDGFFYCNYLKSCESLKCEGHVSSSHGFSCCNNLLSCISSNGMNKCVDLNQCFSKRANGQYRFYCYNSCKNLTDCIGEDSKSSYINVFNLCSELLRCEARPLNTTYVTANGFLQCDKLVECSGWGCGSTSGHGFSECTSVSRCYAPYRCSTNVFNTCYASNSKTSTYACADTANGGFNVSTNPELARVAVFYNSKEYMINVDANNYLTEKLLTDSLSSEVLETDTQSIRGVTKISPSGDKLSKIRLYEDEPLPLGVSEHDVVRLKRLPLLVKRTTGYSYDLSLGLVIDDTSISHSAD